MNELEAAVEEFVEIHAPQLILCSDGDGVTVLQMGSEVPSRTIDEAIVRLLEAKRLMRERGIDEHVQRK